MGRTTIAVTVAVVFAMYAAAVTAASLAHLEQQARSAMQLQADAARGRLLYLSSCSSCHGVGAHGDVVRLIPSLAGQRRAYLIKHLAQLNDRDRAASQMHPTIALGELSTPQAWADVASYLGQCAPLQVSASRNDELAARGARSYRRWCSSCHEADGSGDDAEFVPALRHQHYAYLLKELQMIAAQHRLSIAPEAMRVLDSLSNEQIAGIADHVLRMKNPSGERVRSKDAGTIH